MIRLAAGHLARSRYASVRSLQCYARPGPETIARHLAATAPPYAGRPLNIVYNVDLLNPVPAA